MSIEFGPKVREGRVILVLIPLLILHLALISLQIEDHGGTTLMKKWVLLASSPFFDFSSSLSRGIRGAWSNYIWLHGAREENARLQDIVRQLVLRERELSEAKQENERLRRALEFKSGLPYRSIVAHIVGRVPGFLSNVAFIDRGIADGVQADGPIVTEAGVVGRILLAAQHQAQVLLITNPNASVGVMIERTRVPGVLRGTGNPLLDLNYIGNTEQVNVGDVVLTSGLDGIFPKGFPVGKVVESRKGKSVFRVIQVEPFADLLRAESVLVLFRPFGAG